MDARRWLTAAAVTIGVLCLAESSFAGGLTAAQRKDLASIRTAIYKVHVPVRRDGIEDAEQKLTDAEKRLEIFTKDAGLDADDPRIVSLRKQITSRRESIAKTREKATRGPKTPDRVARKSAQGISFVNQIAPILKKEDGVIDWNWPAKEIVDRSRGFLPWPGAYSFFRGEILHVWKARVGDEPAAGSPGTLVPQKRRLLVACGNNTALELIEIQLEGKRRMSAREFINGHRPKPGDHLGQ